MIVQSWWSLPPAGWITNFVLIIFWASYVIYLYNIHWLLHIHFFAVCLDSLVSPNNEYWQKQFFFKRQWWRVTICFIFFISSVVLSCFAFLGDSLGVPGGTWQGAGGMVQGGPGGCRVWCRVGAGYGAGYGAGVVQGGMQRGLVLPLALS